MKKRTLLLIGNGMAGVRFLEEMVERGATALYHIVVCGEEPEVAYNRIQLSLVLAGSMSIQDIQLRSGQWYADNGIDLRTNTRVANLNCIERIAQLENGEEIPYDVAVLATGSKAFVPPLPGLRESNPHVYRTVKDAEKLQQVAKPGTRATVIGGGLLGLEVAYGLLQQGVYVTVLQGAERVMNQQLEANAGTLLTNKLKAMGLAVMVSTKAACVRQENGLNQVELADGQVIESEHLVVATGITPNTELALQAGLAVGKGVRVDKNLQTTEPNVYAIGECAEHAGTTYGLVEPLYRMATALADRLSDINGPGFMGWQPSTRLKVSGINVFSAGKVEREPGDEEIVLSDPRRSIYRRVLLRDDVLVGSECLGTESLASWHTELLESGKKITGFRSHLLFGKPAEREGVAA